MKEKEAIDKNNISEISQVVNKEALDVNTVSDTVVYEGITERDKVVNP